MSEMCCFELLFDENVRLPSSAVASKGWGRAINHCNSWIKSGVEGSSSESLPSMGCILSSLDVNEIETLVVEFLLTSPNWVILILRVWTSPMMVAYWWLSVIKMPS